MTATTTGNSPDLRGAGRPARELAFKNDFEQHTGPEYPQGHTQGAAQASKGSQARKFARGVRMGKSSKRAGLTREQIALIHVARRDLNLDEDEYRDLLRDAAGVTSSKDLDAVGFRKVMNRFKAIGFVHQSATDAPAVAPAKPARALGVRPGMATPAQIDLINVLWARWHGQANERALNAWIEDRFGVTNTRFASVRVAQMAMEGLKVMTSRQASKEHA